MVNDDDLRSAVNPASSTSDTVLEGAQDLLAMATARAQLRPEVADILGAWLESQLRADQYARLEQAGHSVEDKIPLARVFVDLEVSHSPQPESRGTGEHFEGFIKSVLKRVPVRLTVGAIAPSHEPERASSKARRSSGYVLVGGPGQGKSTVGQFLCQLHRAALLGSRAARLSPEGRQALEALLTQCAGSSLAPPVRPSFPVRVVLGDFAAWLASTGAAAATGLFRYLSERVQHATGRDVAPEELSKLLLACPCLLVFDGLDEVPVTSERHEMLATLRDGLRHLGSGGAKGLVIATTRPQGYAGELLELNLSPLHLVPLSPERAMDYARRLAAVRFADRPDRQERVLERLTQASKEEATARLMRSPLQVTILATLVDRIGRAPQERWSLFLDYYRVVYEREMERSIPAADLLRRYRSHIDRIHAKVGLLLQVESERSGGTEALMTRPRLEQVIEDTLLEDEFDKPQRAALTEIILGAALERLVFLVSPQEGKFGFEIRSLQEFMAAWALMSKSDASLLEQRLAQIAPAESFRNVFLFAASKCFTELSELRDAIVDRICPALNEVDEPSRVTLAGSRLSLELLEEGSALNQPKYARRLMSLATRLLELPPDDVHARLARAGEGDAESPLQKAIGERLMLPDAGMRLPAWVTLVALIDRGVVWARELGEAQWPEDPEEERQIFKTATSSTKRLGVWLQTRVAQRPASFPPNVLGSTLLWFVQRDHSDLLPAWLTAALKTTRAFYTTGDSRLILHHMDESNAAPLVLRFRSIDNDASDAWTSMASMVHPPPSWRPFVEGAKFVVSPTASTLAAALESMRENFGLVPLDWTARRLPWPLRACLVAASSADDLAVLAAHANNGEFGDQRDWRAAEARWKSKGVQHRELIDALDGPLPFRLLEQAPGVTIAMLGILWSDLDLDFKRGTAHLRQLLKEIIDAQRKAGPRSRGVLARWLLDLLGYRWVKWSTESDVLSSSDIEGLWNEANVDLDLNQLHPFFSEEPRWFELLARVGESGKFTSNHQSSWLLRPILDALSLNPENKGLLRIAVSLFIYIFDMIVHVGSPPEIPIAVGMAQRSRDPDIRADATLLMLAGGAAGLDHVDSVIERLSGGSDAKKRIADAAFIASMAIEDAALRERLLLALARAAAPGDWDTLKHVVRGFTKFLRNRQSGLAEPNVWDRLALPPPRPELPRPGSASDSTPPPSERTGSLQIESIKLLGLRIFDEITLAAHPREDGTGQWIVLLGDNGVGKTTILRGVVLALAEPAVSTTLLATLPAPLSRFDAKTSESIVRTREGTYRTRVQIESELEVAHEVASEEGAARRPPLFAYGVRRGSSLGGPARSVDFSPILDVATLFDEAASVIHAETWLQTLALDAEQNPAKRPLFETILGALKRILPGVDAVRVRDKGVWVTRGREELPIAALSDGYLTTAGWFLDLIARWVDRAERRGETLGKEFTATMEGVVLVDEIDLHLHPHWQCTVIEAIRAIFPRMSFIVTTHNPLTLLGAREGEIFVLRRSRDAEGAEGPVNVRQVDLPKGARADQVLTGAWFGLPSTVDPDTQALLDEHRRLLRKRNGGPQTRIQELEAILRERLGSFADTSLERLAQNVAAQLMDERYRELTPEERESIQREVKQRVRAQSGPSENGG